MTRACPPFDHSPFAGHVVVFTGKLSSVGRREARALVQRLGGTAADVVTASTTMLVVGDEGFGTGPSRQTDPSAALEKSRKLKRAEHVNTKSPGQVRILNEDEFCRLGGLPSPRTLAQRYHSLRQIRERYPLVTESRLRHLQAWGLIRPVLRTNADAYCGFADVAVIKQVHDELQAARAFRGIVRRLLAARDGQLSLSFGAGWTDARPAKVVALRERAVTTVAEQTPGDRLWGTDNPQGALAARLFLEGSELDEGTDADRARARTAYRKALLLDPTLVPAIVNLANIHYRNDELVEAQALYGRAISLDGDCFEAYFNLGNIHHDLARFDDAVGFYTDALRLNPTYADAHFYLAVTLEKMSRSEEAKPHWRTYRQLAPDGEWVDLAKEFSD